MMALTYSPTRFGSALSARCTSAIVPSSANDVGVGEISGSDTTELGMRGAAAVAVVVVGAVTGTVAMEVKEDVSACMAVDAVAVVDGRRTAGCHHGIAALTIVNTTSIMR